MTNTTYHNVRDASGRFAPSGQRPQRKKKVTKKKVAKRGSSRKASTKKDNRTKVDMVGHILDCSGSMRGILRPAVEVLNDRIRGVKEFAGNNKQAAYMVNTLFSSSVTIVENGTYHQACQPVPYTTASAHGGMTALEEAVILTIEAMEDRGRRLERDPDNEVTYLLIVITDGMENASSLRYKRKMGQAVTRVQGTDHWSIGFLTPKEGVHYLQRLGIPTGNIETWVPNEEGIRQVAQHTQSAYNTYQTARSTGQTKSDKLFNLDMTKVSKKELRKLRDVSSKFQQWKVDKEAEIADFVNEKLKNRTVARRVGGSSYKIGRAYYQLTKKELIQEYKSIVVQDRRTNEMYTGDEAKDAIGISGRTRVNPVDLSKYTVYVESTSTNRKLVRGTTLLYEKSR